MMYTTVENVQVRYGDPTCDYGMVEKLIEYASALISGYTGKVWDEGEVPGPVEVVCTEIVLRTLHNPTGVTQDTVGPFNASYGSEVAQRMFLTRSDKTILAGFRGPGLQVISTSRGPIETRGVDVPDSLRW